jgi:antitoxin component of MazEF toxin-antitoxin module
LLANDEIETLFARPRPEGKTSLVITIPKHVIDKLKIRKGSRLDLLLYNSFVLLKKREPVDYQREPAPQIFELLDKVFEAFRELRLLERQRFYDNEIDRSEYDTRIEGIHSMLKKSSTEILKILQAQKEPLTSLSFLGEYTNSDEILRILEMMYDTHYGADLE